MVSDYTKSSLCQIDDLKLSCFGCCGKILYTKDYVVRALEENTAEFRAAADVKSFIWRFEPNDLRKCGICPNLVFDDVRKDKVLCPGHPARNNGDDLRKDYCDTLHLCKTAFLFDLWGEDLKKRFMLFLKKKVRRGELDWYSYSMGMDTDALVVEFEESPFWHG